MALVKIVPDLQQKLQILGEEASDELADPASPPETSVPGTQSIQQGITHATGFIYEAAMQGGGRIPLFKVLQTNACRFACR
jgi:predicted DNA-binding helix-hairpin-helix protein